MKYIGVENLWREFTIFKCWYTGLSSSVFSYWGIFRSKSPCNKNSHLSLTLCNSSSKLFRRPFNIINEIKVETTITIDEGIERSFKIYENFAIELKTEPSKLYFISKNSIVYYVYKYENTFIGTWKYIVLPASKVMKKE